MSEHFADFFIQSPAGLVPACGTDAHLHLDGRWGKWRAVEEARAYAIRHHAVHPQWAAFKLYRTRRERTGEERPYYAEML